MCECECWRHRRIRTRRRSHPPLAISRRCSGLIWSAGRTTATLSSPPRAFASKYVSHTYGYSHTPHAGLFACHPPAFRPITPHSSHTRHTPRSCAPLFPHTPHATLVRPTLPTHATRHARAPHSSHTRHTPRCYADARGDVHLGMRAYLVSARPAAPADPHWYGPVVRDAFSPGGPSAALHRELRRLHLALGSLAAQEALAPRGAQAPTPLYPKSTLSLP
jgi:hypothetical protein